MTARWNVSRPPSSSRPRGGMRTAFAVLTAGATAMMSLAIGVTAQADPKPESGEGTLSLLQSGPFEPGETVDISGTGFAELPVDSQWLSVKLFSPDSGSGTQVRLTATQGCGNTVDGEGTFTATMASCLPNSSGDFNMPLTLPEGLQTGTYEVRILGANQLSKYVSFSVQAPESAAGTEETETGTLGASTTETAGAASTTATVTDTASTTSSSTPSSTSGTASTSPMAGASASTGDSDTATTSSKGTLTVAGTVAEGENIVVKGSGWLKADGKTGSVVAFKLDEGSVVPTTTAKNPETGEEIPTNRGVVAVVQAESGTGDFEVTIPFPSSSTVSSFDANKWAAGTKHTVRALAGTLGAKDTQNTQQASFQVVEKGSLTCDADEVAVVHENGDQTATACVQRDVTTGSGQTIRLRGSGWLTEEGKGGATVVVKLASRTDPASDDFQFVHTGSDILKHPTSGAEDATMWALITSDSSGEFDTTVSVPTKENVPSYVEASEGELTAGSKLTVRFQTGLIAGDTQHAVESDSLVVNGTEYEGDATEGQVACTANGSASAHIEYPEGQEENEETGPTYDFGDTVYLVGENWCHPDADQGGSWIGLKIDDGKFSHREGEGVHANMTIWEIIKVNSSDGSFRVPITLPKEGDTEGGSTPEFTEGSHSFRLLSGSLKDGDTSRTMNVGPFTVGSYKPTADAPVLDPESSLTDSTQQGMTAEIRGENIVATIPSTSEGDWVFFSAYVADGSQRNLWSGQWYQADANSSVTLPIGDVELPDGTWRLVAQSNRNDGEVLGWTTMLTGTDSDSDVTVDPGSQSADTQQDSGSDSGTGAQSNSGSNSSGPTTIVRKSPATVIQRQTTSGSSGSSSSSHSNSSSSSSSSTKSKPDSVPKKPVDSYDDLTNANRGDLTATVQDGILRIELPEDAAEAGDWLYVFLYEPGQGIGWVQVDKDRAVEVDVSQLPDGRYRIALVNEDEELIGWVQIAKGNVDSGQEAEDSTEAKAESTSSSSGLSANDWWLLAAAVVILVGGGSIAWILRRPA